MIDRMASLKERPKADRTPSFRSAAEQSTAAGITETTSKTNINTSRKRKKFILCFDGTGNKSHGTDADSNILKIYRTLDQNDPAQF